MSQVLLQPTFDRVEAAPVAAPQANPAVSPSRALRPVVMVTLVALVMIGIQMGLSILLEHGAFEAAKLQTAQSQVTRAKQIVQQQLSVNEAPQTIAEAASKLGLNSVQSPLFVDLTTDKIVGTTKVPTGASAYATVENNLISNAAQKEVSGATKPTVPAAKVIAAKEAEELAESVAAGAQQGIISTGNTVEAPTTSVGADANLVGVPKWSNGTN